MQYADTRALRPGRGETGPGDGSLDLTRIALILREEREERRLSLAAAAEALCIKKSALQAIESGSWGMLPHPVYVRGYIRSYASYLGIHQRIAPELDYSDRPQAGDDPGASHRRLSIFGLFKGALLTCARLIGLVPA